MERALTHEEQVELWSALSDVFVDNSVDYAAVARNVRRFDRALIEHAFFEEVAPVCYQNLQTPVPPIWTAFDKAWVSAAIGTRHQQLRGSAIRRVFDRALVAYLRRSFRAEWREIARYLNQQPVE
ncbi:DUF7079 family protein [Metapseudomonas otitidis]|uniref:DUF7079 family protein n=1 Tax=Metapseudomonas otitidis TaxID=319939 RepID=UPI001F10A0A0|nr:hypothetical protein [Pseudomonas otitidis]